MPAHMTDGRLPDWQQAAAAAAKVATAAAPVYSVQCRQESCVRQLHRNNKALSQVVSRRSSSCSSPFQELEEQDSTATAAAAAFSRAAAAAVKMRIIMTRHADRQVERQQSKKQVHQRIIIMTMMCERGTGVAVSSGRRSWRRRPALHSRNSSDCESLTH